MSDKKHGNPLLADRRSHMNSNGFVLGTSGVGKSFNVKAEMADMFLDRTFDKPIVLDPVSLGDRGGVGAVKPDNAVVAFGGCFDGGVRTLTDAQGHALRFREYLERPGGVSLGLFPVESDAAGEGLPVACELKHHADVRVEDRMARFLVEASRALVGGDAEHERRVVLTRPGVAVPLDLESDAFAPAFPSHGDGLGDAYPLSNHLCGILPTVGGEYGCLLYRWSDEGTAYKAVLGPQPDQGRPERAVVLGEGIWERAVPAMLDFFGQERPDFLCLRLVAHGPADWFERIYTMKSCRTAQQILDSALDAEGGGAMV